MEMNVPEQEGPPPKRMRFGDDSLQNDQMSEVEMTEQFESDENLKQFNFHDANRMFFWSFKPLFALMDKRELSELNKKIATIFEPYPLPHREVPFSWKTEMDYFAEVLTNVGCQSRWLWFELRAQVEAVFRLWHLSKQVNRSSDSFINEEPFSQDVQSICERTERTTHYSADPVINKFWRQTIITITPPVHQTGNQPASGMFAEPSTSRQN